MHPRYVVIHKERGETPLMALARFKGEHSELDSLPASYAGRLDPMAEGKLLVLLGDECKEQERYTKLDKEYEIEVLLDLASDTGDALGMPAYGRRETAPAPPEIQQALRVVKGTHTLPYPSYSSKTVAGKQLFLYALEGALDTIDIPTHEETVYRIQLRQVREYSTEKLRQRVTELLVNVPKDDAPSKGLGADFRQDAIRAAWSSLFADIPERRFTVLTLRVTSASGTYMRTLAERIAKELGTTGLALTINRTKIGRYRPLGSLGFWTKRY